MKSADGDTRIVRVWRGSTIHENAPAYFEHVTQRVFPKLASLQGFVGGQVLRRDAGSGVEFLVLTRWKSWEAIQAFAGDDPDCANVEPAARAVLAEFDNRVRHYEIAHLA